MMASGESRPLLGGGAAGEGTLRARAHEFLEARTPAARLAEAVLIVLILVNVLCFILSTEQSLEGSAASLVFSCVEVVTVLIFTAEYALRFWAVVELRDSKGNQVYEGLWGRLRWAVTDGWSWVDLASVLPFYLDLLLPQDLPATQFIRLARLLRMMKAGGYAEAFSTFEDIFRENRKLLLTSGFVGATTWLILSSFYYLAERGNPDMIWEYPGCNPPSSSPSSSSALPDCPNRFGSITTSLYYTLLNLFGEFPLVDNHGTWGRIIGVFTAVVAVAVFAIPTGIFGAGFEDMIQRRKKARLEEAAAAAEAAAYDDAPPGALLPASGKAFVDGDVAVSAVSEAGLRAALEGRGVTGRVYVGFTFLLIVVDVLAWMASTTTTVQTAGPGSSWAVGLGVVELLSAGLFTLDYIVRIAAAARDGRTMRYLLSEYGLVDLLSVLPFYLSLGAGGGVDSVSPDTAATVFRALRMVRMLKGERFVKAFTAIDDIIRDDLDILAVSGFVAVVIWVFASTLLYYTERNGPDPDVAQYYQSVPLSMWITLLNLSGEAPLADYSGWGKVIVACLGIFGVGVFAVPVGLVGAGFEEWVAEIAEEEEGDEGAVVNARPEVNKYASYEPIEDRGDPQDAPLRRKLFVFLQGRTPWGMRFEAFVMLLIVLTVMQAILMTLPSVCANTEDCPALFDWVELFAVLVFTVEYFLRLYAAPDDPEYQGSSPLVARLRHVVSFYSIVDFLATFPYYAAQVSTTVDQYDNYLRLLRLLRILKMDKYVPSVSLIDDVFRIKARGLIISGFASAIMLVWFSSLLYLSERYDDTKVDCYAEEARFRSVPRSLQYDLVLLTGDYPLIDFTTIGKYVNVLQIMVAVGVVAVPSGLIAGGFTELLEQRRTAKRQRRQAAAVLLQKQVRGHLARRAFRMTVEGAQALEADREAKAATAAAVAAQLPVYSKVQQACHRFVSGQTPLGAAFRAFVGALIALNVAAVVAESEPSLGGEPGWQSFFDAFEAFSVAVFTLEICMRVFTAPVSSQYLSRRAYLGSFFGIVDVAAVLPWYMETSLVAAGVSFDASAFRVLRLFRLLQLEHFVSAFTLLDDVWRACRATLAATGLLALVVWVGSACLFYLFEKDNTCSGTAEAFSSIPSAMYYVAVFLGGEWGLVDFTIPGRILCCVLCVVGIALFAIPVGTIFEAFDDVLAEEKGSGGGDDDEE